MKMLILPLLALLWSAATAAAEQHLLYVAAPGIRNYVESGGQGIIVFDIDHNHQFLRRIPIPALDEKEAAAKGICASSATGRLYVTTTKNLSCLDLKTDKVLWQRAYPKGCDRMSISPDGKEIYCPSLEGPVWYSIDALSGDVIATIEAKSGAHNTIFGPDGKEVYLAGLKSPILRIADAKTNQIIREVGPFSNVIRPFTINGDQTLCFVNVNELLGFEVGDLKTGKFVCQVKVEGFKKGATKRHGCPSHGIGLTPDGKELWLTDAHNQRLHIFDATTMPPKMITSIELRDQPGWITFGLDGRYAYPSTGDVVDVQSHKVIAGLKDEQGREVQSEKLLEVDFDNGAVLRAGNQFGLSNPNR